MYERRCALGSQIAREKGRRDEIIGGNVKCGSFIALRDPSVILSYHQDNTHLECNGVDHRTRSELHNLDNKFEATLFMLIPERIVSWAVLIPLIWEYAVVKSARRGVLVDRDEPEAQSSESSVDEYCYGILWRFETLLGKWKLCRDSLYQGRGV